MYTHLYLTCIRSLSYILYPCPKPVLHARFLGQEFKMVVLAAPHPDMGRIHWWVINLHIEYSVLFVCMSNVYLIYLYIRTRTPYRICPLCVYCEKNHTPYYTHSIHT